MSRTLQQVILNNKTLWLVADVGEREGPLCATPEDYAHGRPSYAHLFPDGRINRFNTKIGEFSDLKFTGVCQDVDPADDAWDNLLSNIWNVPS